MNVANRVVPWRNPEALLTAFNTLAYLHDAGYTQQATYIGPNQSEKFAHVLVQQAVAQRALTGPDHVFWRAGQRRMNMRSGDFKLFGEVPMCKVCGPEFARRMACIPECAGRVSKQTRTLIPPSSSKTGS